MPSKSPRCSGKVLIVGVIWSDRVPPCGSFARVNRVARGQYPGLKGRPRPVVKLLHALCGRVHRRARP